MAGQTFGIVDSNVGVDGLMRVVACEAADALVIACEAFAIFEPVGLEADVGLPVPVVANGGIPGAMALAAEVRGVLSSHGLERLGDGGEVISNGIDHVLLRAQMTTFASETWTELIECELRLVCSIRRMTVEALNDLPDRDFAAYSLIEAVGHYVPITGGSGESLLQLEVA